ncbi:hypothetical protein ACN6K9_006903 [Streptomyces sp. SAS_267]|uniref:hypothetical protein n=1 Tax=unclassified Streptomyces TaxID=2593676 RepID=UPI003655C2BB
MGRVGRNWPKVQVTSRLTWTFSAGAAMGSSRPDRPRRRHALSAAGLRVSASLLDSVLRTARSRPRPPVARTPRRLRIRPR